MVEAEEGNSWIYKNKDHGRKFICRRLYEMYDITLCFAGRNVVCGCEPWS